MNCHQCRKVHKDSLDSLALTTPTGTMLFCDYVCLRDWMRVPPPLTEGMPDPRRPALSPQDVVVCEHKSIARVGEGLWWCVKCNALVEVSLFRRDR